MRIQTFMLKNVRCFAGEQKFNIRPLTLLVGENSTGKTTVLGCIQALSDYFNRDILDPWRISLDFNREPYEMGVFADIARKTGGRGGKSDSFQLGFEVRIDQAETVNYVVELVERERGAEPGVKKIRMIFKDGEIISEAKKEEEQEQVPFRLDGPYLGSKENEFLFKLNLASKSANSLHMLHRLDNPEKSTDDLEKFEKYLQNVYSRLGVGNNEQNPVLNNLLNVTWPWDPRFESFAPLRSKPKPIYYPEREVEDAEGSEMPMVLRNMSRFDSNRWEKIRKELITFGNASGLFQDISVRKLGNSTNDPFQLQVKARGPKVNIIGVGYGVNQLLPILVCILRREKHWRRELRDSAFLIQQPEVHLHPKGQAELASLLIALSQKLKHSFVVETHSDYMIDRARIEIRKGNIRPEDVSLIYLEPKQRSVKAHNISFDRMGNLVGTPTHYGEFFLKETDRLLGFED